MSDSSANTQSPPHLHLHVGSTSATAAATTTTNGSESSSHHSPRTPRRRIPRAADGRSGSGSGQINAACAACKYQRRRCHPKDCLLAPYFPADQTLRFLNAHRLFGVSNITKTLKQIEPKYWPDAMRSIIFQSEARAADPVGGCVGIIEELRRQMRHTEMELQFVMQQIAICRQASATDGGLSDPAAAMILPAANNPEAVAGQQDDVTAAVAAICAAQQPSIPAGDLRSDPSSHQQQLYDYFCYNNGAAAGDVSTSDDDDGGMKQYGFADGSVKAGSWSPAMALSEQLGQHCQIQASSPFVDAFNVKPQKKLGAPFKSEHDGVDEPMAGTPPCHLELGFSSSSSSSSSFYNA